MCGEKTLSMAPREEVDFFFFELSQIYYEFQS